MWNCPYFRLSQSPSLLISASGSWPQHERLLSPAARQIYRRNFSPVGFIQSRTVLLMRLQSNPITLYETWLELCWSKFSWSVYFFFLRAVFWFRFIACIQIVRSKMTSLDEIFCSGNKSRSRSLAYILLQKTKISTARASRSWKNLSSTCRQVYPYFSSTC